MNLLKKAAISLAAVSSIVAPVAASAAQTAVDSSRAVATANQKSNLEGGSGILIAILAAAAVIAGIVIIADGGNDNPTSP